MIERILKYASIKHILEKSYNDDEKILEILNEVLRDIKNYELEFRIAELESKFSKDLSEATFNELKELKKLHDDGVLTKEEFTKAKKKLLN